MGFFPINMKVIFLCILFMFIGPTLIMLNKYILHDLNFPYPMFLSGLGVLFSALTAQLLVALGYVKLHKKEAVEGILWYKRVLPIGLAHASALSFGNIAYLFLNVGFIQMLKSFVPVIVMIVLYLAGIETPTRAVIISISIISVGIAGTCSFTPEMNIIGLFCMFIAETAEAIRLVLTQFFLQNLKFSILEGQYTLAPASAFWLFLAAFIFEIPTMLSNDAFMIILSNPILFLAAASLGLGVNYLTYYVIQITSSLTMKILGSVRNIMTVFSSVLMYNETVNFNEGFGYSVAFFGFLLYSAIKAGYFDNSNYSGICCSSNNSNNRMITKTINNSNNNNSNNNSNSIFDKKNDILPIHNNNIANTYTSSSSLLLSSNHAANNNDDDDDDGARDPLLISGITASKA